MRSCPPPPRGGRSIHTLTMETQKPTYRRLEATTRPTCRSPGADGGAVFAMALAAPV
jgi:hypothetical protein